MKKDIRKVLVVNAGSSSLKYMLFDMKGEKMLCKGLVERIGIPGSRLAYQKAGADKIVKDVKAPDHAEALKAVVAAVSDSENGVIKSLKEIDAIGHRVLHGAEVFSDSAVMDAKTLAVCEKLVKFGPLHMPPNLGGIKACRKIFPGVPNVGVFDTAFHQTMPDCAALYAIAPEFYEKMGIRKYGFHGTSHKFVTHAAAKWLKKPLKKVNVVTCHLGNGSSITAVKGGKCIDTSMGLTPLDGFIMGTRCGAVDPSVITYLQQKEGWTPAETDTILNKKSGVLGISGVGSDDRDVSAAEANGNERAHLARSIQKYQVRKLIGSYVAAMNGVDAIVFTGGIGENTFDLRADVCNNLSYLGIEFDDAANEIMRRGKEGEISTANSKVKVFVLPTNEELVIARDTKAIVEAM